MSNRSDLSAPRMMKSDSAHNQLSGDFDPMRAVERDFGERSVVFREGVWQPPPLETRIMTFFRRWTGTGRLLVLGAGSTHIYNMLSVADQVTQITALDVARQNIDVTRELLDGLAGQQAPGTYVQAPHFVWLKHLAEALLCTSQFGPGTADQRLRDVVACHRSPAGTWNLIQADMFRLAQLDVAPVECVLMSESLYVPSGADPLASVAALLTSVTAKLVPGGRFVLCDLPDFNDHHIIGDYQEAPGVAESFTCDFAIDAGLLSAGARMAGLRLLHMAEDTSGSEVERHIFLVAEKPAR